MSSTLIRQRPRFGGFCAKVFDPSRVLWSDLGHVGQITAIRARDWRTEDSRKGPREETQYSRWHHTADALWILDRVITHGHGPPGA